MINCYCDLSCIIDGVCILCGRKYEHKMNCERKFATCEETAEFELFDGTFCCANCLEMGEKADVKRVL